jgi:serine/threonine protein kinase
VPGGQTLKGRYEIKEALGRGGMGVVYRAWDSVVRRDVAVKTLSDISDPEAVRRFLEECAIIAKLSHPNLIEIFDLGEVEEGERRYPFYVMPLLAGATLDRLLRRERLSVERVVDIVCQACRGLQAAHDKGLVHRDIKPSNLFILQDNSVRIIDFGIAQRSGQAVSEVAGTLLYMAPESLGSKPPEYLLGNPLSAASDIYSLAVVCYEALTGRRPFDGTSDAAKIAAILQATPVPAAELNPAVSEPLSRAVARGMARPSGGALAERPGVRRSAAGDAARGSIGNGAVAGRRPRHASGSGRPRARSGGSARFPTSRRPPTADRPTASKLAEPEAAGPLGADGSVGDRARGRVRHPVGGPNRAARYPALPARGLGGRALDLDRRPYRGSGGRNRTVAQTAGAR